ASYNKHVPIMLPIAPDHIALEGATRADRHRQNIARLWDGLELDLFAESNVTVCDCFRGLLPLAADAEGRNPETYLDCLRHLLVRKQNALLHDRTSRLADRLRSEQSLPYTHAAPN
ncbi:MAG TPA: hypothetical protein VHJ77_21045, partial [Vicinamibacterales bacterium]|nr:hypothetical protein [Vicinamibacterales bacterium]